jgi:uncharacterized protein (TIGR01777 family)
LRITITGASGLIGSALTARWRAAAHDVVPLRRGVHWDPEAGTVRQDALAGADAVVHLAGANIAARRWNAAHKERIHRSRVAGTAAIARAVAAVPGVPPVLVCASALGYYGDRGEETLTESSPPGHDFLAQSCVAWENAAAPARAAGARVAHLRMGIVLAPHGGALARMLPPFRFGLGGRLGSGRQWMSWVALSDVVAVFDRALHDTTIAGPVNVVAPQPVRNVEFTRALGAALRRPAFLVVPGWALRALFGEMADALLLSSARVLPARLEAAGYRFQHPELEPALHEVLG